MSFICYTSGIVSKLSVSILVGVNNTYMTNWHGDNFAILGTLRLSFRETFGRGAMAGGTTSGVRLSCLIPLRDRENRGRRPGQRLHPSARVAVNSSGAGTFVPYSFLFILSDVQGNWCGNQAERKHFVNSKAVSSPHSQALGFRSQVTFL